MTAVVNCYVSGAIISEATRSVCSYSSDYPYMSVWTAGQRIVPTTGSRFIWRVITTDERNGIHHRDTVTEMAYTNWHPGQPNNYENREACMVLYGSSWYQWADRQCSGNWCPLCEIDMP